MFNQNEFCTENLFDEIIPPLLLLRFQITTFTPLLNRHTQYYNLLFAFILPSFLSFFLPLFYPIFDKGGTICLPRLKRGVWM